MFVNNCSFASLADAAVPLTIDQPSSDAGPPAHDINCRERFDIGPAWSIDARRCVSVLTRMKKSQPIADPTRFASSAVMLNGSPVSSPQMPRRDMSMSCTRRLPLNDSTSLSATSLSSEVPLGVMIAARCAAQRHRREKKNSNERQDPH